MLPPAVAPRTYRDAPSRIHSVFGECVGRIALAPFTPPPGDLGSVQPLSEGHLLVGWGGVKPEDRKVPQRGASIIRLSDGEEVFALDLSPGWVSYRAKALQP